MAWPKSGRSIYLIAGGSILLVFLIGLLCAIWLFSQRQQPVITVTPEVAFATVTPGGSPFNGAQPPTLAAGSVATPCGPLPAGWRPYLIRPGDTLSQLAEQAGVNQAEVLAVNCLVSPELLAGTPLYLPPLPTPTPCTVVPPPGWSLYTAQAGDTLSTLAAARGIALEEVKRRNCLASADILVGQQFYLPPLPTPTPCVVSPPPGWGLYTIQSGDTLFSLAAARGVTAGQIQQVNCLVSETIQVGQQLYLPLLPTPTIPPPPAALPTLAPPPFAQAGISPDALPPQSGAMPPENGQVPFPGGEQPGIAGGPGAGPPEPAGIIGPPRLPNLVFQPGYGNEGIISCPDSRLEILGASQITTTITTQPGQQLYFFAHNFADEPAAAAMSWPGGQAQPVDRFDFIPIPITQTQEQEKEAQAVFHWPVLPFYPLGPYTLTITGTQQSRVACTFEVVPADIKHILVVPPVGPPGSIFQVYYIGFTLHTTVPLTIYGKSDISTLDLMGSNELPLVGQLPLELEINQPFLATSRPRLNGWGVYSLYLGPAEPPGIYLIDAESRVFTRTVASPGDIAGNILWLREVTPGQ